MKYDSDCNLINEAIFVGMKHLHNDDDDDDDDDDAV
jgi:hypothetical protein